MSLQVINSLVDKVDNSEIIRDRIAAILAAETVNQQGKAADPEPYRLRIFAERSNPWEEYRADDGEDIDTAPIVNVWWDGSSFLGTSSAQLKQDAEGTFNIDCYGYGESMATGEGHEPGDEAAAKVAHRAARLCRNWIMAGINHSLQLPGVVAGRFIERMNSFQPQEGDLPVQNVIGFRIALNVKYIESSPEYIGELLESIGFTMKNEHGEIIAELEYRG